MNGRLRKIIRQDAKQALSGKWLTAIGICFLFVLVTSPASFPSIGRGANFPSAGMGLAFSWFLCRPL